MKIANYFKQWGESWPVIALIILSGIGAGLLSGIIALPFGLLIELTGMAEPGDESRRWAFAVWCAGMVVTLPIQVNSALRNWYRDRLREDDRAHDAEMAQIEAENQAALASGGEAALARLRNERWARENGSRR